MKYLILLPLFLSFAFAQSEPGKTYESQTKEYAIISVMKNDVGIDIGQLWKIGSDQRLKDDAGAVVKVNSEADALNYMNSKGWVLLPIYSTPGKFYFERPKK